MLNCCIERKIKREQLYKGYIGQFFEEQKDLDSEEVVFSQLIILDFEFCVVLEVEQSKESGVSGIIVIVSKEFIGRLQQFKKEQ